MSVLCVHLLKISKHLTCVPHTSHRIGSCTQSRFLQGKAPSSTTTHSMNLWTRLWSKMFGKYLFATNVLSSGVLMVIGDVAAQEIEIRRGLHTNKHYDNARIWRMFIAGALQGPLHHWVYKWMDRKIPQRTFRAAINKILIDQFIMSPLCIVVFFYSICLLERQSLQSTNQEIKEKFIYVYLMDWMFWPAAQYVNFRYFDTKYRVGFVNVCTAIYNIFISYIKHDFDVTSSVANLSHKSDTTNTGVD